jgi:hypothetical protein
MNVNVQLQAAAALKADGKEGRQCTHKGENGARSCNHSSRAKAGSMTYSEFVSIDLDIQHAMSMRRITFRLWSVWFYHTFTDYLIHGTILEWGGGIY